MSAVALHEVRRSQAVLPDGADLRAALAQALALAELANSWRVAFQLNQSGGIVLPDTNPATGDDQAQIRAIAPLYLAAQLEYAMLVPSVELMTSLAMSGGLPVELGSAASSIAEFWRQRHERFTENERRAFFARLFGSENNPGETEGQTGRVHLNSAFEDLMIDLCEALYKLDEQAISAYGSPQQQTRLRATAQNMAQNLLERGVVAVTFAAQEILKTVQGAIQILDQPAVQHALGVRSLWDVVNSVAKRYLHTQPDTSAYVRRGESGLIVISWVADSLPSLNNSGQPLLTLNHPVIPAAADWLQASLSIREAAPTARAGA